MYFVDTASSAGIIEIRRGPERRRKLGPNMTWSGYIL